MRLFDFYFMKNYPNKSYLDTETILEHAKNTGCSYFEAYAVILEDELVESRITNAEAFAAMRDKNVRLLEALKWAEPYVPKVCETRRMIEDILSNTYVV